MATVTLTPEQYAQFQSLLHEKEQRDAMIIHSAKGNLTVKSNAFGAKGRVFLQPVRYPNGQTLVRTGGNIPATFHIDTTTNRLVCVIQTESLAPKDIEYWHKSFTNMSGPINNAPFVPISQPQQTIQTQPMPQPMGIPATPTAAQTVVESEDNPSEATIAKASKYVKAGAYPDLETAIREVLKSKKK